MPTSTESETPPRRSVLPPYLPFLAFGPVDLWFRLLNRPKARAPLRYLPRLLLGIGFSFVITLLTLPERLLVGLWLKLVKKRQRLPGPVVILGYYRSGTTHLQFLLSRDPHLYSLRVRWRRPRWWCRSR